VIETPAGRESIDLRSALIAASDAVERDAPEFLYSVGTELRVNFNEDMTPILALLHACEWALVRENDSERRSKWGAFAPIGEGAFGAYPPPLGVVGPQYASAWEQLATDDTIHPRLRGRFGDLLWTLRHGPSPHEWAAAAIDAYISSRRDSQYEFDYREALVRALELAARLNDTVRKHNVINKLVELAEDGLARTDPAPGLVLPILEAVAERPETERPSGFEDLVERSIAAYSDDPWNFEAAINIKLHLSAATERPVLRSAQVDSFLRLGRQMTGVAKLAFLQHALQLAATGDLSALASDIRVEIESISHEELGLQRTSSSFEIPADVIDNEIAYIVGNDSVGDAADRFGSYLPIGDIAEARDFVRRLAAEHPLLHLIPEMTIGPFNSITSETSTPEEKEEQELLKHELMRVNFFSHVGYESLRQALMKYAPTHSEVAALFETDIIEGAVASKIASALAFFEAGDYDTAGFALAPRLERIVRRIAFRCGVPVTKGADARGRPGGVRGLGALVDALEGRVDERIRRYWRAVLSEPTGLNLRNDVAHALIDEVKPPQTVLLLHVAFQARLLVATQASKGST
jgi:hypothetical protein